MKQVEDQQSLISTNFQYKKSSIPTPTQNLNKNTPCCRLHSSIHFNEFIMGLAYRLLINDQSRTGV